MIARPLSSCVLVIVVALAFAAGCAGVINPKMKDSATVRGSLPFFHSHEQTIIVRIDGAWRGVTLSPNLYLSPGKHELAVNTLYLADPDDDSESSKTTSIEAVFLANHRYIVRRSENHRLLLLYDETSEDKKAVLVGKWEIGVEDFFYEEP